MRGKGRNLSSVTSKIRASYNYLPALNPKVRMSYGATQDIHFQSLGSPSSGEEASQSSPAMTSGRKDVTLQAQPSRPALFKSKINPVSSLLPSLKNSDSQTSNESGPNLHERLNNPDFQKKYKQAVLMHIRQIGDLIMHENHGWKLPAHFKEDYFEHYLQPEYGNGKPKKKKRPQKNEFIREEINE